MLSFYVCSDCTYMSLVFCKDITANFLKISPIKQPTNLISLSLIKNQLQKQSHIYVTELGELKGVGNK